ncbi:MAG TPA: hypothetical protein VFC03_07940, partial [Acidimicrobiales bacterium]|nr:hypothetical protein [Acidimicrobiales bacterium]
MQHEIAHTETEELCAADRAQRMQHAPGGRTRFPERGRLGLRALASQLDRVALEPCVQGGGECLLGCGAGQEVHRKPIAADDMVGEVPDRPSVARRRSTPCTRGDRIELPGVCRR